MLGMGAALFLVPGSVSSLWPWKLTALTSRAIGAWLLGIGVYAIHSTVENDFDRIKPGMISYLALGLLQLIALARYPSDIDWTNAVTWIYVVFVVSIILVGCYGTLRSRYFRKNGTLITY
jgi:hypothetical protein